MREKLFNKALKHMLSQGAYAVVNGIYCAYRAPNGLKCAVGALIPDDKYDPWCDDINKLATYGPILRAVGLEVTDENKVFLFGLQYDLHDRWAFSNAYFRSSNDLIGSPKYMKQIKEFANTWGLQILEDEEC